MRACYLYNEILPKKSAHDVYIFHQCNALAAQGLVVSLLCGRGKMTLTQLREHYNAEHSFTITQLPIIRKNNPLNISWNRPFFFLAQRALKKLAPRVVFLSVSKQAKYHLKRRLPSTFYIYEAHELSYYPDCDFDPARAKEESSLFNLADLVVVSTEAMKEILLSAPYALQTPVEVIPLAVGAKELPPPPAAITPALFYVGQLYDGQGIPLLLKALERVPEWSLKIVGGKPHEINNLSTLAKTLKMQNRVEFLGFCPPSKLSELVKEAHAFIAPFEAKGRMPYVAHTKLLEYAHWGRPIIAPDLPAVREHFPGRKGVMLFKAEDLDSLSDALQQMLKAERRAQLQQEIGQYKNGFTWEKRAIHYKHLIEQVRY